MVLGHLEEAVFKSGEKTLEEFLALQDALDNSAPRRTFLSALDLNAYIRSGLLSNLTFVGAYGALMHLVDKFGTEVLTHWKGNDHVVLLGSSDSLIQLHRSYGLAAKREETIGIASSSNFLIEEDPSRGSYHFDTYASYEDRYSRTQTNGLFGIEFTVEDPLVMIKRNLGLIENPRVNDNRNPEWGGSILSLLSLIERTGIYNPEQIIKGFSDQDPDDRLGIFSRDELSRMLAGKYGIIEPVVPGYVPSEAYQRDLRAALKPLRRASSVPPRRSSSKGSTYAR